MPRNPRDFRFIEARLRKMTFGILSTVNPGGRLQTPGILYGVWSRRLARIIHEGPKRCMHCYGVGFGVMERSRYPSEAGYAVEVPSDRL